MPRIDDLSDTEFMELQAGYGDSPPICAICTLEDVRYLLLELVAGDEVSDEVKSALAPPARQRPWAFYAFTKRPNLFLRLGWAVTDAAQC